MKPSYGALILFMTLSTGKNRLCVSSLLTDFTLLFIGKNVFVLQCGGARKFEKLFLPYLDFYQLWLNTLISCSGKLNAEVCLARKSFSWWEMTLKCQFPSPCLHIQPVLLAFFGAFWLWVSPLKSALMSQMSNKSFKQRYRAEQYISKANNTHSMV